MFKIASGFPDASLEQFLKLKNTGFKFRIPQNIGRTQVSLDVLEAAKLQPEKDLKQEKESNNQAQSNLPEFAESQWVDYFRAPM